MSKDETNSKEIQVVEDGKSVPPVGHNLATKEDRVKRALILDAKLNDALLDTFIYSAELVDEQLYKELVNPETDQPFKTAKEYFQVKSISLTQAYRYAQIGREIKPQLLAGNSKFSGDVAGIGVKKLQEIVRYASDQMDSLMGSGEIKLGDEVYSAEDLKDITYNEFRDEIRKANKKIENYEVEVEKRKNAELERDQLRKENQKLADEKERFRDRAETEEQVLADLESAEKAMVRARECLTRIDPENVPERFEFRMVSLIEDLGKAHEDFADGKFFDLMLKHNDIV